MPAAGIGPASPPHLTDTLRAGAVKATAVFPERAPGDARSREGLTLGDGNPEAATSSVWRRYLAGGVLAAGVYLLLPRGGLAQALVFAGVHISALVAILVGLRVNRPATGRIWRTLALGHAVYATANIASYLYPVARHTALPHPSLGDGLYLTADGIVLAGFGLLLAARTRARDRASLLDAVIVTVGLGVLSWVFLMAPYAGDPGLSPGARLISLAYPLLDVVLLALLVRMALLPGAHPTAFRLIGLGLLAQLIGDTLFAATSLAGTFSYGSPAYAIWLTCFSLVGAAALHPSMHSLAEPAPETHALLTRRRLALLAGTALVAPIMDGIPALEEHSVVLSATSALLFLLVLARMRGLMIDVADRRRIEQLKDEFTSLVSHELRTPLTSIRGALGLLAAGVFGTLPEKGQRMLEIAAQNTDRLVRLINDILDIERIESGKALMQRQPCAAAELIEQATELMQPMAQEAHVQLTSEPAHGRAWGDPDRLVQTLTNLIANAIKFSPQGATVSVGASRNNGEVLFVVKDEGRGIPPDKLETIFRRFQQVDPSDSRREQGTGLGLAICRSIVQQHGGRIWAESEPERGSVFFFTVPALETQPEPAPTVARGGPTVLVCDDDPGFLEVVEQMLLRRGFRPILATSGEQAVHSAKKDQPQVIVLDLLMPGMSGWDTAAALKGRGATREIPIVVLTIVPERDGRGLEHEVVDWLEKPVDEASLLEALDKALGRQERPRRVLVVEDDIDLAKVLTGIFERHGVETFHAASGHEAIELSRRLLPDLLVLDLMLPDQDGFSVVDWLRRHERLRDVCMVVHTARDLEEAERERLRLGRTEFFIKGRISPEEFEQRITELLGRITAHRGGSGERPRNDADPSSLGLRRVSHRPARAANPAQSRK